jgi:protein-L-isoaspartate(D-aspartate) O-methyltransferase
MTGSEPPPRKFPLPLERLRAAPSGAARLGVPVPTARAVAAAPLPPLSGTTRVPRAGAPPAGLGLDSADVRRRMVERLREGGVTHPHVLAAFAKVPRHLFVDAALGTQAYEDTALPIGHGQTISKPSVVARMLEMLLAGSNARAAGHLGGVLEIGTGCGYQAALLCEVGRRVVSVERLRSMHDKARELLAPMRSHRLRLVLDDGMRGHPPGAPYDSIIAAAGGNDIPAAWLEQLAIGGRLVSPVEQGSGVQALVIVDRAEAGFTRTVHGAVKFVPLKSGLA